MNSKRIGNIGEVKTLSKLVELMVPVYIPFGDNEKTDLVAEWGNKLVKIQCKTSEKVVDGKIVFHLTSSTVHRTGGVVHKYNSTEIDFFSVYNIESKVLLLLPIEKFNARNSVSFALEYKPSRNQFEALNWEDYTFENIILKTI